MRHHVIVLPGGGYHMHAPHEAEPVADWLQQLGLESSVFRYPVGVRHPEVRDAVRAQVLAARAAGADRVALLGFSAGGHAAGHTALDPGDAHVDAVILGYPVVSMQLPTHAGSREMLLGADASPELRRGTSLEELVSPAAPPFFVWHTAADASVPVEHAYLLGSALAAAGVRHELHVFPRGPHGLGLAVGAGAAERWTDLCATWLRAEGWLG